MNSNNFEQLYDLLDTLPNPVTLNKLVYDDKGEAYDKIVYVNKAFINTIGYRVDDIPDDRVWFAKAYPDPAYQKYIVDEWFKAVENATNEKNELVGFPAKVYCKDGKDRWFNFTTQLTHPINNEYRTIVLVETESISETKLKLDEKSLDLMHKDALLKTIIDTAPTRIFWKDKEGVYLGCNAAFLHDARLEKESDIIGKTDYDMVWKENAELFREDDRCVRESGIPKLNYEEEQPQENGKTLILSTSKVPLQDVSGNIIGILGLYQDITQEHETREKLKEKERLLHVQSRQAAMGEMISMIAHQWKQPLSTISAVANDIQVQQALGSSSEKEMIEQSKVILDQTQFLSQTISDFRNFFIQEKSTKTIKVEDTINDALLIINKLLLYNNIELRTVNNSQRTFITYPKELQHVFINLMKNSVDALMENKQDDGWIEISSKETDEFLIIEVGDNAGGIDSDILERIFDPYFSTKDEQVGTGLGLHMSKVIIEQHLKGNLSCHNSNVGAVFTLNLPWIFENTVNQF